MSLRPKQIEDYTHEDWLEAGKLFGQFLEGEAGQWLMDFLEYLARQTQRAAFNDAEDRFTYWRAKHDAVVQLGMELAQVPQFAASLETSFSKRGVFFSPRVGDGGEPAGL